MVSRAASAGLVAAVGTRDEMELVMSKAELAAAKQSEPAPAPALPPPALAPVRQAAGNWQVQLGAFRQPGAAQSLFGRLAPQLPGKRASYVPLGGLTRLLVGPFASKDEAKTACRALGPSQGCFPVAAN